MVLFSTTDRRDKGANMSKHFLLTIILIFSVCQSFANDEDFKISPRELPSLIIAYNFCTAYYPYFKGLWESTDQQPFMIKKLSAEFTRFKTLGIERRLLFTHRAFIVQNDISNHISGFPSTEIPPKDLIVPFESIIFVTTPIASINDKVLVILSSVSPERTTIMAIDSYLNIAVLYDSYAADNKITICSIYSVRVLKAGVFVIAERSNNRCSLKEEKRSFILDLSSGVLKLHEREKK